MAKGPSSELVTEVADGVFLYKLGILYGSNASGKSNMLIAMNEVFRLLVMPKSDATVEIGGCIPFMLTKDEPTEMHVSFYADGTRYDYDVKFNGKHILSEALYYYPNKSKSLFYERSFVGENVQADIKFGASLKLQVKTQESIRENTLNNHSVLSVCRKAALKEDIAPFNALHAWIMSNYHDVDGDVEKGLVEILIQKQILKSIRDDFGRYINSRGETKTNEVLKLRAEACLDSLPAQLSKEYKKFQHSLIEGKIRSEDKADALQYLADLGLVLKSYNLREISSPLEAAKISGEYKVFYSDIGLLVSQLGDDAAVKILNGELSAYKGAITENMAAIGFHTSGKALYYYRGSSGSPELDFIVDKGNQPTIVECKATNNRAGSMKYVIAHPEKYGKHPAIKISDTNIGTGDGFTTYPIYYPGFMQAEKAHLILPEQDFSKLTIPT